MKEANLTQRCTAMLGVSVSGQKMSPFVIFTGTENGRASKQLNKVNVLSGNMDSSGFSRHYKYVIQKTYG